MKLEGTHGGRMIGSVLSRNLVPDGDYTPTQERTMEHNRRQGARSDPQEKTNVFFFFFFFLLCWVLDISAEAKSTGKVIISEATRQYRLSECVCVCRYKQILGPNRIRNNNHPMLQIETTHHHREGCSFFYIQRQQKKTRG